MAKIALQEAASGAPGNDREFLFAVGQTFKMLQHLKMHYYAAWNGENPKPQD